jgi:hypothetical protein
LATDCFYTSKIPSPSKYFQKSIVPSCSKTEDASGFTESSMLPDGMFTNIGLYFGRYFEQSFPKIKCKKHEPFLNI